MVHSSHFETKYMNSLGAIKKKTLLIAPKTYNQKMYPKKITGVCTMKQKKALSICTFLPSFQHEINILVHKFIITCYQNLSSLSRRSTPKNVLIKCIFCPTINCTSWNRKDKTSLYTNSVIGRNVFLCSQYFSNFILS
jgi:hypothetical protein